MGSKKHTVNLMFTIALLGVFALTSLLVAVMGAQVYKSSADKMSKNYDIRTSVVYITEKMRQAGADTYSKTRIGDSDAVLLTEELAGQTYETYIYVYDGKLYELLLEQGMDVKPGMGQRIMDLKNLLVDEDGALMTLTVTDDSDNDYSVSMARRT